MILSIRHKALRQYYETGNGKGLPADQLRKIARILTALDAVTSENDIVQLGSGIHRLKGDYKGFWAISVSGNYRILFRFEIPDIVDVNYLDYH